MTHTLHRRGDFDSLKEDFPMLAMSAKGVNDEGSAEKMRRLFQILLKYDITNFGDMKKGNKFTTDIETIMESIKDSSIVHAVFRDKDELVRCMKELKEADLGISVVVSGVHDEVDECCHEAGIKWHITEYSLGVHGKLEKLPDEDFLEFSTMCGHGMVAAGLARKLILDIKKKRTTYKEAAEELAKQCCCGIFNPYRAEKLLRKASASWCLVES